MKIKNFLILSALLLLAACSSVNVPAGSEAVIVTRPYFFGHGGVDKTPITTGRTFIAWTSDEILFPVTPIRADVGFDDIITIDNVAVDFHAFLTYKVINGKSPELLKNFGTEWFNNNVEQTFKTEIRKQASKYSMMKLATRTPALDTLESKVQSFMSNYVKANKIPIEIIVVQIGKASPNEGVMNAMNETAAQQQRLQTEREKAKAEGAREIAEVARARADNAYRNAMGLSPNQFIQLEAVKAQIRVAEEASSKNATVIIGSIPDNVVIRGQ
jgi:regulator of protease activity HflC (stomatin/prohibitin superfamily)